MSHTPLPRVPRLAPPPTSDNPGVLLRYAGQSFRALHIVLIAMADAVNALLAHGEIVPTPLASFTVATLPATAEEGDIIFVTDEVGGSVPAFWDGTNWRRVTDRVIVS